MHRRWIETPGAALLLSTHPGPTLAVTLITVLLGWGVGLEPWRLVALGAAMLLGQASVGLANDWIDADRDRATGRTDKPAATGAVTVASVRSAAFVSLAAAVAITLALGLPAALAHLVFLAAGWTYNIWLKATVLSWLPYVVGFGTLPVFVTSALTVPAFASWWAIAAGASLGFSAHLANALPDLVADRATGVIGFPHRIGPRASGILTFLALAAATVLVVEGPSDPPDTLDWLAVGAETLIVVAGLTLAAARTPGRAVFRLVIIGALVAVLALVFSSEGLLG